VRNYESRYSGAATDLKLAAPLPPTFWVTAHSKGVSSCVTLA